MTWCENNGMDYIFGLAGNVVLDRLVEPAADDIRVRRAVNQDRVLRGFAETHYAAKSWNKERRVVARIEASASHADDMLRRGIDIRYIITSLQGAMPSTFIKRSTAHVGRLSHPTVAVTVAQKCAVSHLLRSTRPSEGQAPHHHAVETLCQ